MNFGQRLRPLLVEDGAVVLPQLNSVVRLVNVDRNLGLVGAADCEDRE